MCIDLCGFGKITLQFYERTPFLYSGIYIHTSNVAHVCCLVMGTSLTFYIVWDMNRTRAVCTSESSTIPCTVKSMVQLTCTSVNSYGSRGLSVVNTIPEQSSACSCCKTCKLHGYCALWWCL